MSEHFAKDAALVAALPADDPEVRAAVAHARECAACAAALEQGQLLVALLDAAPAPPPPSKEALARAAAAVAAEIAAEEAQRAPSRVAFALPVAAVGVAWAFELAIAKRLEHDATHVMVAAALALGAIGLAAASAKLPRAAIVVAALTSAAVALAMGSSSGLEARIGAKCTLLELVAGALPWVVGYVVARRSRRTFDVAQGAGLAAAGALAGHAALHLACKVAHADAHLLVFHLGGVVLAPLIAWITGRALARRVA